MIRKDPKMRSGIRKTYITVVEGYRPGPGLPPKQRTVKSFGYLEDQDDPDAFMSIVKEFDATYRVQNAPLRIEADGTARMYDKENRRLNYGYRFLEAVYDSLGIDEFVARHGISGRRRTGYDPALILKHLVLARILRPDSKRATCQMKDGFYGKEAGFSLPDVYRSLDCFASFDTELQRHLNEMVKATAGRDLSYAFYDVTNYFFDIDFPDGDDDLRKKGVSKEHRVNPIVAMGLFMDSNGLPVSMSMFPGNTSDTKTLQPVMEDVKSSYGLGRVIVVADKGLNSSTNIDAIIANGDGFIFSQILRGKKGQRYNEELFDKDGWTVNDDGSYRYKLFDEGYVGKDCNGKKETRTRRVLLYWSRADAEMARRKREEKLRKAEKAIGNNAYAIKHGYEEYTKEEVIDGDTGEFLDGVKKKRSVNMEKAEKDAAYDGYFCIITSETGYSERQIRKAYGGLWRIEESFRIMKSDLYARPVFVRKNEHIRAHFLICFIALLIIRMVQLKMGDRALPAERISRALGLATCRLLKGGVVHLDDVGGAIAFQKTLDKSGKLVDTLAYSDVDEIAVDYKVIQDAFGTDCYKMYMRQEEFNRFLKSVSVP
jgi:hypothetical protein